MPKTSRLTTRLALAGLLISGLAVSMLPAPVSAASTLPPPGTNCPLGPCNPPPPPPPPPGTNCTGLCVPPPGTDGTDGSSTSGGNTPTTTSYIDRKSDLSINCEIKDEAAMTTGMWIINTGEEALGNGKKIRFVIPSTGERGALKLEKPLLPNGRVLVADLFDVAVAVGEQCDVKLLS